MSLTIHELLQKGILTQAEMTQFQDVLSGKDRFGVKTNGRGNVEGDLMEQLLKKRRVQFIGLMDHAHPTREERILFSKNNCNRLIKHKVKAVFTEINEQEMAYYCEKLQKETNLTQDLGHYALNLLHASQTGKLAVVASDMRPKLAEEDIPFTMFKIQKELTARFREGEDYMQHLPPDYSLERQREVFSHALSNLIFATEYAIEASNKLALLYPHRLDLKEMTGFYEDFYDVLRHLELRHEYTSHYCLLKKMEETWPKAGHPLNPHQQINLPIQPLTTAHFERATSNVLNETKPLYSDELYQEAEFSYQELIEKTLPKSNVPRKEMTDIPWLLQELLFQRAIHAVYENKLSSFIYGDERVDCLYKAMEATWQEQEKELILSNHHAAKLMADFPLKNGEKIIFHWGAGHTHYNFKNGIDELSLQYLVEAGKQKLADPKKMVLVGTVASPEEFEKVLNRIRSGDIVDPPEYLYMPEHRVWDEEKKENVTLPARAINVQELLAAEAQRTAEIGVGRER